MFWVVGVAYTLAWDYLPGIPQGEDANRYFAWYEKPFGSVFSRYILRWDNTITFPPFIKLPTGDSHSDNSSGASTPEATPTSPLLSKSTAASSQTISYVSVPSTQRTLETVPSTLTQRIIQLTLSMFTPITSALYISLPIALIRPLKALFVQVPQSSGNMTVIWPAPDGRPPLAFIIDTGRASGNLVQRIKLTTLFSAQWMGNLAVPLALIVLGASFARMSVPRPLSRLPISAMLACAAAKMMILPVVGVCIVRAMVKSGWISREAKVEQFVAMLLSGTPAAVK